MTTDPKPRRAKRTPEQRIADLDAQKAREVAKIEKAVRDQAEVARGILFGIGETTWAIPQEIRSECVRMEEILDRWLKGGEGKAPSGS